MKRFALIASIIALAFGLTACEQPQPVAYATQGTVDAQQAPQYVQGAPVYAPAPVVVQSHSDGLVEGMLLGHMLSGGGGYGGRSVVNHTTVVNKTVNKTYTPSPAPRTTYSPRSYSASRSSFGGSSFGGSRGRR